MAESNMFEGYIDSISADGIIGWAWNPAVDGPVTLEILLDNASVGIIKASLHREDLERAGKRRGYHGFSFPLPKDLAQTPHTFVVRNASMGQQLVGSPFVFQKAKDPAEDAPAHPAPQQIEGYIDSISGGALLGWAWNPVVDGPVMLEVLLDKASVGTVKASLYRQDLERAGKRRGYHGFSFPLPKDLGPGAHTFTVRCPDTQQVLAGCPFEFTHDGEQFLADETARPEVVARPQLGRLDLTRFSATNLPSKVVHNICTRFLEAGLIAELATYVSGMAANGRASPGEKFEAVAACARNADSSVGRVMALPCAGSFTVDEAASIAAYLERRRSWRPEDADNIRAGQNSGFWDGSANRNEPN